MKLLKRLFKFAAILTVAFVAIGLATFALGGRVVMDGGGGLHLRFPESAAARERVVQAHRKAQEAVPPQLGNPGPLDTVTVLPTNKPLPVDSDYPSPLPKSTEWTDFRGPRRDGRYEGSPLRAKWPVDGLKPLWKQPIGEGYASFVISDGRAFTIEQRGEREVVAAYDVKTGRQIWTNTWTAAFREFMGGDGPRATPTFADGLLYALGA